MWQYKDVNDKEVVWYSEEEYLQVSLLAQRMAMASEYLQNMLDEVIAISKDVVDKKCDVLGTHNQQLLIVEKMGVKKNETNTRTEVSRIA